jgi:hypothetical protein
MTRVPEVAFAPLQLPLAVHDVALVLDQVNVTEPVVSVEGAVVLRLNETVGTPDAGITDTRIV